MTSAVTIPERRRARPKQAKSKAQDEQVMGTNNSSIVSKRSVERLYYPNDAHFFRFFVKKFQRRAPLINRGYFLRLHVIDVIVRSFLMSQGDRQKVVVNLGCGSDVLPWQCMDRYPSYCENATFVDIDFPELMNKKRETVLSTPELRACLTGLETSDDSPVSLKSDQYYQVGCDLGHIDVLQASLSSIVDLSACCFLFVAEVSITYMETEAADALVRWTSTLGHTEFCLLEQILPDGPDHPFAKTMISHFEKLNTPLKSVHTYPTLRDQVSRFSSRGWSSVVAWTLWEAWANSAFLTPSARRELDDVEPFDEWEEFALFGSHYCVVHAKSREDLPALKPPPLEGKTQFPVERIMMDYQEHPGQKRQRRFGVAMSLESPLGERFIANVMGSGNSSRLSSSDLYRTSEISGDIVVNGHGPAGRMCHTSTEIGSSRVLIVGGRTSPTNPLKDCWLFARGTNRWERSHDLPIPLYRHSVTGLRKSFLVLLIGGKTGASTIFGGCLLFHPERGWRKCNISGYPYQPVFGANFVWTSRESTTKHSGLLVGGISADAEIAEQLLSWTLDLADLDKPVISFQNLSMPTTIQRRLLNRFGAMPFYRDGNLILVGGVSKDHLLSWEQEILGCEVASRSFDMHCKLPEPDMPGVRPTERPLLVGHSAEISEDGSIDVLGGGATCFSFGTFWSLGAYTIHTERSCNSRSPMVFHKTVEILPEIETSRGPPRLGDGPLEAKITTIPRVTIKSSEDFQMLLQDGQPVVLQGLDLGPCTTQWTLDLLLDKVGRDHQVVVHESSSRGMDFNTKNFRYVTKTFVDFAAEVKEGRRVYLRALSAAGPADLPANLARDFPSLAPEFVLPAELSFVSDNTFSSVLRISGPVNMWLHYDVMANVYSQISGSKRLLLFPPSDVQHLGFAPGASSSSIDVFSSLDSPSLGSTHPHEAVLSPGDVLFLPPLWLHAATPTSDVSVAVNVFFRDLAGGYSTGRDIYGNRDLAVYEKGRQDIGRLVNGFQKLPASVREFYLLRLSDELRHKSKG